MLKAWNMLCYFNCAPCLYGKGSKDSIRLEIFMNFSFTATISFKPKLWKFNDSDSHRERWMMMIANTKAAFSVQPSLVPSSFFNETFFLLLLSTRNLVHAPKLITCRMNGRELWKRNPLFWKAHPHSFKHSHRERFPGGQKVRSGFTFTAKLWSFTTSNKMTNSCDGKLFSPNFLLALKRRH